MGKIRKSFVTISFLLCGLVYYLLFFTRVFNSALREFAYILSGHPIDVAKSLVQSRDVIEYVGEKGYPLYQYFSSTLVSQLQYGPYMNLVVYMIALFTVVPIYLIAKFIQTYRQNLNVQEEKKHAREFKKHFLNYLIFTFVISGIGSTLSALLAALFIKSGPTSANQAAIQNNLQANFIITFIPIALLAPIIEEIVFRGVLLSGVKSLLEKSITWKTKRITISKKHLISFTYAELGSLLFSSTLFALIHLSTNINQWVYFPAYFCGGIALGGIYVINRERIYSSIFVHATYNAVPVLIMTIIRLVLGGK